MRRPAARGQVLSPVAHCRAWPSGFSSWPPTHLLHARSPLPAPGRWLRKALPATATVRSINVRAARAGASVQVVSGVQLLDHQTVVAAQIAHLPSAEVVKHANRMAEQFDVFLEVLFFLECEIQIALRCIFAP